MYELTYDKTQKELARYYTSSLKDIKNDITKLYAYLLENAADGHITPNDLYRYDRYFQTMDQINGRLMALGHKEVKVLNKRMLEMWDKAREELVKYGPSVFKQVVADPSLAQAVIDSVWCADGKHWSERVFQHKAQLQEALQQGLMDCVAQGADVDKLTRTIRDKAQVGWHNAQRIARTELSHVQIQSNLNLYSQAGFDYYKFLSMDDGKTCKDGEEKCEDISHLNGGIYSILEAQTGVNLPPIHPNCRCSIIPIMKGVNDNV